MLAVGNALVRMLRFLLSSYLVSCRLFSAYWAWAMAKPFSRASWSLLFIFLMLFLASCKSSSVFGNGKVWSKQFHHCNISMCCCSRRNRAQFLSEGLKLFGISPVRTAAVWLIYLPCPICCVRSGTLRIVGHSAFSFQRWILQLHQRAVAHCGPLEQPTWLLCRHVAL